MTHSWMVVAAAGLICVATGCARVTVVEETGLVAIGQKAEDMSRAKAIVIAEQMADLANIQSVNNEYCDQLVKEVFMYRDMKAYAYIDPLLLPTERLAYAASYESLAINREAQVDRCKELSSAFDGSLALLSVRRHNRLREAEVYGQMKWSAP